MVPVEPDDAFKPIDWEGGIVFIIMQFFFCEFKALNYQATK